MDFDEASGSWISESSAIPDALARAPLLILTNIDRMLGSGKRKREAMGTLRKKKKRLSPSQMYYDISIRSGGIDNEKCVELQRKIVGKRDPLEVIFTF